MTAVRYLADTHVILWSLADDPRLRAAHRDILASEATVFASAASVWEIAIKRASGKLRAPDDLVALLPRMRFTPLPVTFEHAEAVGRLPGNHGDPFDRLIVAQAMVEGLTLLSDDGLVASYGVPLA